MMNIALILLLVAVAILAHAEYKSRKSAHRMLVENLKLIKDNQYLCQCLDALGVKYASSARYTK